MADSASNKTEAPTAERLRKARDEGQIPQSMEVPSALIIAMLLIVLGMTGPSLQEWFASQVRSGVSFHYRPLDAGEMAQFLGDKARDSLWAVMPFLLGAMIVSVVSSYLTSGWSVSPKALHLNLGRLSPISGFKSLLSARSGVNLLTAILKLLVVGLILWYYLRDKLEVCLSLVGQSPQELIAAISTLVFGVMLRVGVAMLLIGAADFIYQKWKHKHDLRMTLQEVKEERKQHEASPQIKGRIRAIQFEMARRRMLHEVPKADVVLANPTHVSVALKYDSATMDAPVVLAKGPDLMAEQIKEIARANGVPIVYRPELARALFAAAEVGKPVPETLFVAVAEVLAMIYRLRNKKLSVGAKK